MIGARNHGEHEDDTGETAECHCIATREILSQEESTSKFIPLKSCKEIMIPSTIKRMFEQDFSENQETNSAMSQEDLKSMKITAGCIHKAGNGHYEVPLLLHDENGLLSFNKKLAEIRLKQLRRRLASDSKYKEDYVAFMEKMPEAGHAEKAPKQCHGRTCYFPQHGMYHPKRPDKL